MRKEACSREQEVLQATRAKAASEEQQRHLDTCPACQDSLMVASWMQGVARTAGQTTPLPDAQSIWWRSRVLKQLCEREDRIDRRTRPLMLVQGLATLMAVLTITAIALTNESLLRALGVVVGALGGAEAMDGVPTALVAAALLSLGAGAAVAWRMSAELS